MTLHGGSGTNDDDLRDAIAAGIDIVHINTELRVAWRRGLEDALMKHANEIVPYKILPAAVDAVKKVVSSRLKLFPGRMRNESDHSSFILHLQCNPHSAKRPLRSGLSYLTTSFMKARLI